MCQMLHSQAGAEASPTTCQCFPPANAWPGEEGSSLEKNKQMTLEVLGNTGL